MRETEYYIAMDKHERGSITNSLNNLQIKLIADGKYTNALDGIPVRVASAPIKNSRLSTRRLADRKDT